MTADMHRDPTNAVIHRLHRHVAAEAWRIEAVPDKNRTATRSVAAVCFLQRASEASVQLYSTQRPSSCSTLHRSTAASYANNMDVIIAVFSWCTCGHQLLSGKHLSVTKRASRLESKEAIALSYAIGDFGRAKHTFGHLDGIDGSIVELEFGKEWTIPSLQDALAKLSEKHGAIWIDQLCIVQTPAEITKALRNMEKIYSTFDVVILLPNTPCPCLEDRLQEFEAYNASTAHGEESVAPRLEIMCNAAVPVSSYNFRLWTKQEFSFARAITVRCCGPPASLCWPTWPVTTGVSESLQSLGTGKSPPLVPYWIRNREGLSIPEDDVLMHGPEGDVAFIDAMSKVMVLTGTIRKSMKVMVMDPFHLQDPGDIPLNIAFAKFIRGERFQKPQSWSGSWSGFRALHTRNMATCVLDYALAVLPSVPGYTLPEKWSDMSLVELLDDGIGQHERKVATCVKTSLPKGLFVEEPGSMQWKPSLYLDPIRVRDIKDVYGSLFDREYKSIPKQYGSAALVFRDHLDKRVSRFPQSQSYNSAFGDKSSAESVEFMRAVTKDIRDKGGHGVDVHGLHSWAVVLIEDETPLERWSSSEHAAAFFRTLIFWNDKALDNWIWPELDHETLCYEYMCRFVGIHPEVARKKGLGLIVKKGEPPCIGLMNKEHFDSLEEDERHGARKTEKACNDWLTVEGIPGVLGSWHLLSLECYRSKAHTGDKDSLPKYHVKGVWYHSLGEDESIGADVVDSADAYNAILV